MARVCEQVETGGAVSGSLSVFQDTGAGCCAGDGAWAAGGCVGGTCAQRDLFAVRVDGDGCGGAEVYLDLVADRDGGSCRDAGPLVLSGDGNGEGP